MDVSQITEVNTPETGLQNTFIIVGTVKMKESESG
jgi:hypothetical protein